MINDIIKLFSEECIEAFNEGTASLLVKNRNRNIGAMFSSERSVYYIQILFRMLCFRREHELEPLNNEIFIAVRQAQILLSDDEYTTDNYNHDIQQLLDWKLINRRIEKERLRGYKDVRREKFRLRLKEETVSFLVWLEDRLSSDIERKTEDTRNLLLDVAGRLKETSRDLTKIASDCTGEDENDLRIARTVIYNISCLNNLTLNTSKQLTDLNSELLMFLVKNYNVEEAKKAIKVLEFYSGAYLLHIHKLRNEIVENIELIVFSEDNRSKLVACHRIMEEEYTKIPTMSNIGKSNKTPDLILKNIFDFYVASGKLDLLCERINQSAMKVWGKLSAHLRELERTNTRLEDLTARMKEFAGFNEDETGKQFFNELLCPAYMKYDPNYWDDHELADPPMHRTHKKHHVKIPGKYSPKKHYFNDEDFVSMEQAKLDDLHTWLRNKFSSNETEISISDGEFDQMDDFKKIIELIKVGYLGNGKKLKKINYTLRPGEDESVVKIGDRILEFDQLLLKPL